MKSKTRVFVRGAVIGTVAAASSLQAHLPGISGSDIMDCFLATVVATGAYAGIAFATPLEPSVGPGSPPSK
jgi:uncharacterized membrane protein YccC